MNLIRCLLLNLSLTLQVVTIPTAVSPDMPMGETSADKVGVSTQQQQHSAGIHAGGRTVVAKPLHPNQTLPPSVMTNLVSIGNPSPTTRKAKKGLLKLFFFFFFFFLVCVCVCVCVCNSTGPRSLLSAVWTSQADTTDAIG